MSSRMRRSHGPGPAGTLPPRLSDQPIPACRSLPIAERSADEQNPDRSQRADHPSQENLEPLIARARPIHERPALLNAKA